MVNLRHVICHVRSSHHLHTSIWRDIVQWHNNPHILGYGRTVQAHSVRDTFGAEAFSCCPVRYNPQYNENLRSKNHCSTDIIDNWGIVYHSRTPHFCNSAVVWLVIAQAAIQWWYGYQQMGHFYHSKLCHVGVTFSQKTPISRRLERISGGLMRYPNTSTLNRSIALNIRTIASPSMVSLSTVSRIIYWIGCNTCGIVRFYIPSAVSYFQHIFAPQWQMTAGF